MNILEILNTTSSNMDETVLDLISQLTKDESVESLKALGELLIFQAPSGRNANGVLWSSLEKSLLRLTSLSLLQKGEVGVAVILSSFTHFESRHPRHDLFAAIWCAARGKIAPDPFDKVLPFQPPQQLVRPFTDACVEAARGAINELIVEARTSQAIFDAMFLFFVLNFVNIGQNDCDGIGMDDISEQSQIYLNKRSLFGDAEVLKK